MSPRMQINKHEECSHSEITTAATLNVNAGVDINTKSI